MIKRLVLTLVLGVSFLTFYYFIPFRIFSYSPIIFSGVFSFVTEIWIVLLIFNIGSFKEWKLLRLRTKKLYTFWAAFYLVAVLLFVGLFFVYLFNYTNRESKEFDINSKETQGIILDIRTEEKTRRFFTYKFTHIKVRYKVDDKQFISEHITTQGMTENLPEIGQSIIIFYSKSNPLRFETIWERQIRVYDPMKDPENLKRKIFIDSVLRVRNK